MEKRELVCIVCPTGCILTVETDGDNTVRVTGNGCKRGADYGRKEAVHPTRTLTSTVLVEKGKKRLLPVRTSREIPKELIFSCMELIRQARATAPVRAGDIILRNVLETGADIIACTDIEEEPAP